MQGAEPEALTEILVKASGGNVDAMNRLFPIVYDELRRLAHSRLRSERPDHTLNTTALVHEAYMKLVGAGGDWNSKGHFECVAARAMQHVLVDHARALRADKRGGIGRLRVKLTEELAQTSGGPLDALALGETLARLQDLDPEAVSVLVLRCLCGLDLQIIAHKLGISVRTVERRLGHARSWLAKELVGEGRELRAARLRHQLGTPRARSCVGRSRAVASSDLHVGYVERVKGLEPSTFSLGS